MKPIRFLCLFFIIIKSSIAQPNSDFEVTKKQGIHLNDETLNQLLQKELRLKRIGRLGLLVSSGSAIILSINKVEPRFETVFISVPLTISFYSLSKQKSIRRKAVHRFFELTRKI